MEDKKIVLFVSDVINETMTGIKASKLKVSYNDAQEIIRVNLCKALRLRGETSKMNVAIDLVGAYRSIIRSYFGIVLLEREKQGILEACVHGCEMVLKGGNTGEDFI